VNALQPEHAGSADAFFARLSSGDVVNHPPAAHAGNDQVVNSDGCPVAVHLDGTMSSDSDGDGLQYVWSGAFGTATGATPTVQLAPGVHAITLSVDDGHGGVAADEVVITVVDTVPPEIVAVAANPAVLNSANHQMVPVSVSVSVSASCDQKASCRIVSVRSNEPVDGVGDGDTAPDWEITGSLTLKLRAERSGGGTGRVYTITVECVDAAGNAVTSTVAVLVPRAQ
jgi:hypothetical protein